jgi:hypothetical protein
MTFSDGSTTIHHAANHCEKHPDREGKNLCVHCGKWFCDDCMSVTHRFLCEPCAAGAVEAKRERDIERERPRSPFVIPLIFGAFFLVTLVLRKLGIWLIAVPLFFLFVLHQFLPRRHIPWGHPRGARKDNQKGPVMKPKGLFNKKEAEITPQQLSTVLRLGGGAVTAGKLARAAGVSEESAKKFLDKQVVDGSLSVEAGDTELVYIKHGSL